MEDNTTPEKRKKRTKNDKKIKKKDKKRKKKNKKKDKKEKRLRYTLKEKTQSIPQSLDVKKKKTHRERDSGTGDRPPRYAGEKMCVGPGGSTIMENTARLPDNAVMGVAG